MPVPPMSMLFFKTESGNEPVKEWLKEFQPIDKKTIGEDIRTIQIGWPLGMPLVRKMDTDLWEIRVNISFGIARIFFTVSDNTMLLLHGFVKKSQSTPKTDLALAKTRLKQSRRS